MSLHLKQTPSFFSEVQPEGQPRKTKGNRLLLPRIQRHCLALPKLEMVQRRAARFVKGMYGMFESVTQMLEQLAWILLSKRRENSCLILLYKIINNLAVVPHSCLEKAAVLTGKIMLKSFAT